MTTVAIVGSGPAGIAAAWPLVQRGHDVLMLDAAILEGRPPPAPGPIGAFRRDPGRWRHQFGADLAGLVTAADQSPKLATPLGRHVAAGFAAATGLETRNFIAMGGLGRGGLSRIWGGVAAELQEADFAGWPIGKADLARSLAAIIARIGVSTAGQDGPALTPPLAHLAAALARQPPPGVSLAPAVNAVIPRAAPNGCQDCGTCLWGCARGAIYDSGSELDALLRAPNFRYLPDRTVTAVRSEAGSVTLAGAWGQVQAASALLAAGAIGSTVLVARALRQTEFRLLTNPVAAMAFLVPAHVGAPLPEHSFALAQLLHAQPIAGGGEAVGALYGADALPAAEIASRLPLARPAALRLARALAPGLVLATLYLPGRFSDNLLTVTADGVRIAGNRTAEAEHALRQAAATLARALRRLGAWKLPGSLVLSPPGADAHYAGTLPMGAATSALGEVPGLPGVHVIDGAALPSLPARHCTLTIMANADRIGRAIAHAGD